MTKKEWVVGIYDDKNDAKAAVTALLKEGIAKRAISVIGRGHEEMIEDFELEKENSDIAFWGTQGAFWGAILGALLGGVFFVVPGFGPIVAAGPITAALAGMVGGAMTGGAALGLADALIEWGIGEAEAKRIEKEISQNRLAVVVHGDKEIVEKAYAILESLGKGEVKIHR